MQNKLTKYVLALGAAIELPFSTVLLYNSTHELGYYGWFALPVILVLAFTVICSMILEMD